MRVRRFSCFYQYIVQPDAFVIGFYLHTVLVVAFAKTQILMKAFYVIGWGLPLMPAIIYAAVRSLDPREDIKCWTDAGKYLYILAVPVILSLVVRKCAWQFNHANSRIRFLSILGQPDFSVQHRSRTDHEDACHTKQSGRPSYTQSCSSYTYTRTVTRSAVYSVSIQTRRKSRCWHNFRL